MRCLLRALCLAVLLAAPTPAEAQQRFDVIIRGGRILDGTGNPWFYGDVGITGDRVSAIGNLSQATATRVIDATGSIVSPGFIDIHSHADDSGAGRRTLRSDDPRVRAAPNLVAQGITTVVVNQDGRSAVWPVSAQISTYERLKIGPNALLLVGHGAVRSRVLGQDVRRPATAEEIAQMKVLVRQAMREGASGMSAGLEYAPGRWSTTDEVVALAEEIVPFRGVYISHERSEGSDPMWYWPSRDSAGPPTLLDAVRETIEIGERTGAIVVASHIKAKGAHYWGSGAAAIQLIQAARARGVSIYADQYPYETSGTDGSTVLIPDWALSESAPGETGTDYAARLQRVISDARMNTDLRRDITHEISRRGGAAKIVIFAHPDSSYVGKSLADIAALMRTNPVDAAINLQLHGDKSRRGGARVRGFSLSELDLDMYAAQPWVATATDGGIALPDDGAGTHARFYGTFPRKIRYFALERGVLSLEDAIRSATSLPAQILGLQDRGILRAGSFADIVVFDPNRIRDTATFFAPHQYPEGMSFVLINGQLVLDGGKMTGALPGKVITTGPAR